ncbi:LacI family DNA-binding transcriptional regulator [Isoptericola sp. AK164]|uniref:LacI family DNA-binding transcriptional regulator n=1 Tax=Isoptericola sp. AK164 TaxID=3024246 RepID=UPI0024185D65|nr:LacI family DNA-binding transcriptional regulator [Isoptericola sp. AK164]
MPTGPSQPGAPPAQLGARRREHVLRRLRTDGTVRVNDLAAELGVSAMTVRRDLNALATRGLLDRVHGGATLPDPFVPASERGTPDGRSRFTVGLVVPQLDYYFPPLVAGARAAAAAAGVRLVIRTTAYDPDEERHQVRRLAETPGIDGLVVAPDVRGAAGAELLRRLDRLPLPVVLAERQPPGPMPLARLEWVAADHVAGAATAVWHLHAQGHRSIGLLTLAASTTSDLLHHGWSDALRSLDVDPAQQLTGPTDGFGAPGRAEVLAGVLDDVVASGTTAVVVQGDPAAVNLAQYCAEAGVVVPDDLAIVAYDDQVAELADPPLTAVRPPLPEVGRLAVETVVARLVEGAERSVHRSLIAPALVVRASSTAVARSSDAVESCP